MANLEDVYIRIHLDSTNTPGEIVSLSDAVDKYKKKLQELQELAKKEGRDERDDPEIQRIAHKLQNLDSLMKQNRKWFKDIEGIMGHLLQSTTKELKAALKQLNSEMNDLTRTGGDVAKIAEVQDRINRIQGELSRRGSQTRPLAQIQKDLAVDKLSIQRLRELRQELETLKVTTSNANTRSGAIQEIAILDERMKKMNAQPLRDLSTVIANIGNANNGSITRLKELREELVRIQQTSTKASEIKLATAEIAKLDARLKEMQSLPTQPARKLNEILSDIGNAKTLGDMERLRDELKSVFKTIANPAEAVLAKQKLDSLESAIKNFGTETVNVFAVLRNPQNYNLSQVTAAIKQLEEKFNNIKVGPTFDSLRQRYAADIQTLKDYKEAAEAALRPATMSNADAVGLARGGNGTVAQLREAMKVLEEFREKSLQTSDTTQLAQYNKYIADLKKRIDEATTSVRQMDVQSAQWLANGAITGTVAELKEAKTVLEAYKQTLATTDTKGLKQVNDQLKAIDSQLDVVNGKTKQVMTAAAANTAYSNAQVALRNGTKSEANAVRELIAMMKEAQSIEGLSIKQSQEYADMERQLTDLLNGKGQTMMTAAEGARAMNQAETLLQQGETATAAAVRKTIEALKQAQLIEGNSIAEKTEYAQMQKKLEEQLKGSATAELHYGECLDISRRGTSASVGEINRAIESLRILAQQENTTAADAQKYNALIKQLQQSMSSAAKSSMNLVEKEKFVNDTLKNLRSAPVEDLEKAVKFLEERMKSLQRNTKEYVRVSNELKKVKANIDSVTTSVQKQEDFMSCGMAKLMKYLGIFGGFYLVRNKMQEAIKANMDYDDSLTNIRKTTGLTSESVKMLADNIKKIDTRTSLADMNELAYSAGRLGVKGVSDVMAFVKSANILKVALGEQLGEGSEAVEQLLKVTTIMGTTREYGMEDALLKTGAAINHLTMNSQATAQPMVDFLKRTAGLATQAGVTTDALVGLAGAVNALGQPVEMSATSVSKMMVQISKNSLGVARALQMTNEETEKFIYQISAGDMMDAFITMLRKVGEQGGLSHLSTIIKDLGGEGQRVIQTLSTLSANVDLVENMVRMSTQAFEEGTSAIDEYNIKNENTVALMERLKNSFSKMMVSTEAVSFMHDILVDMQGLPKAARQIVESFQFVGDILSWVAKQISENTHYLVGLLQAMAARTVVTFAANLSLMAGEAVKGGAAIVVTTLNLGKMAVQLTVTALTLGKFTLGLNTANWSFKNLLTSAKNFFNFLKSAQFGNVFTAVAAVAFAFYEKVAQKSRESAQALKENQELLENVKEQAKQQTASVNTLLDRLQKAWDKTDERKNILLELNNTYGDYIGNLIDENAGYEQIEQTLKAVNEQLRMKSLLEARDKRLSEITSENSTELGTKRGNVLSTIASFISGEGSNAKNAASSELLRRMLQVDASTGRMRAYDFFDFDVDAASGVASNFRVKKDAGTRGMSQAVINDFLQLMRGVVDEQVKKEKELGNTVDLDVQNRRKTSWGNTETVYGQVLYQLQEFLNTNAGVEEKKYNAAQGFQTDIDDAASRAQDYFVKTEKDLWSLLGDVISDSGNLADHVAKTISESGKREKDYWVTRKAQLVKDGKLAEEEKQVKNYATAARAVVEEMRGKGWANEALYNQAKQRVASGNTQDGDKARIENYEKYLQLYYRQMNAEEYLRVLRPGNIEQKPDEKTDAKAAREAKQEMDNLIQKIKTFYEIQAKAYKEMRQKQQITETEYQRYLEQNNRDMSASLADAYAALAQDADMTEERYKQITERMRQENKRSGAGAIGETQIGIVSGTSYASVQNINKQLSGDKENGTAWTNSMRRKRREEEGNVIESLNKEMQARIKAWLEQNPLGKIAQDFQKQFEEMGLLIHIKPEVDADGVEIRNLDQVQNDLMKQMLEIGRTVSAYNVTTAEGRKEFAAYVKDLEKFPDVARTVVMETDTDISSFYYKIYEYAEQYEEQMKRLTDRTMKMWTKMYADTPAHRAIQEELNGLALLQKRYTELEKFGLHQRFNMDANVRKAQLEYDNAIAALEDKAARARAHMASAQALKVGDKTTDGTDVTAQFRDAEIASAQAEIDALQSEGQQVVEIYGKVIDAQAAVREATYEWVASMKDAFAKFADGFAPFRSWYEEKGSPALNIFGTKSERQEAFGQFMDDLKKLVRAALMEQMQLKMSKWLNLPDKADAYSKSSSKPAEDAVGNIIGKSDAEVDIVSLEENKTSELDVIKASNYQKEEEARRHKAEMDAIESGSSTGNVMDEDTKSSLKARAFAEEMSIEQAMEEQKLNMKAAAEQSLQNLAMQGIQKMLKQKQKAAKEEFKITKLSAKDRTKIEEEANEETGESAIGLAGIQAQISERIKNIRIDNSKETAAQEQSDDVTSAGVSMWGSFGGAVAKAWEEGGPYLGPVLAAVVSAAVGSLITWVMNMMGSSSKSASAAPKTKLVSGMLTYDSGNVQSFRGIPTYDGGGSAPKNINMLPVMGDDGRVYMVPEGDMMGKNNMSGFTGIVRRPTLTTVGGAPALVAERGPEMVIGRETTHAMMMSRPDLLRAIVEFDRNRSRGFAKTFDSGNVSQLATVPEGSPEGNNSQLMEVLDAQTAMLSQMYEINAALTAELRKGIGVRKYGAGGLIEETAAGFAEARRLGNNKNVTRLFGSR